MNNSEIINKTYSMFYPKTKAGILVDYPELKKHEIFTKINKFELLFAWYFACKASPFDYEEDVREKTILALRESFGDKKAVKLKETFLAGNFSEKLRAAIVEMRKFQIGPRIRAKIMTEKIMSNYEKLIDIDVDTEFKGKEGEGEDWTKKKAYIDSCAKISLTIPMLINQAEGGFGVTEIEEGETVEIEAQDLIDIFHESQDS